MEEFACTGSGFENEISGKNTQNNLYGLLFK
jgi:hypothetical protein